MSKRRIKNSCWLKLAREPFIFDDFDIILKKDTRPQIIDASCRLSGSSTASLSIGLNIPIILLRLLSNERVNVKKLKKIYHVFPQNRFELIKK